jgi:hypothetical protein
MNLFWARALNVTAALHFESVHRFKTLPLYLKATACFREREVDFARRRIESFSLRETGLAVSLRMLAASAALKTSAV